MSVEARLARLARRRRAWGNRTRLPEGLHGLTGFVMEAVARGILAEYERSLSAIGVTIREFTVLVTVRDAWTTGHGGVGYRLDLDRTTVSCTVRALADRGLIVRSRAPGDRRKYELRMTDEGRKLASAAARALRDAEGRVLEALHPLERQRVRKNLLASLPLEPTFLDLLVSHGW